MSIEDDPCQGRPKFQRTDENVQKITDLIKENPRTTLLELEQDTGISKTTIGWIVTEDLKLKKTPAKFIPRFLTNEQKLCRLATYIAPNDFFLFPKLKAVLKGRHFDTRDDIIEKSPLALKSIPKEAYKNCFDNWEKRWRWSRDPPLIFTRRPLKKAKIVILALAVAASRAVEYGKQGGYGKAQGVLVHEPQNYQQDYGKQDSFSVGPQSYSGREAYGRGVTQPQNRGRRVYKAPQQGYQMQQQTYGAQQQGSVAQQGAQEQAYGAQQKAYGAQQQAYGAQQQAYGAQEQAYGPQQKVYSAQQKSYGGQQQAYAPKQQGYKPQPIYAGKENVDRDSRSDYLLSAEERPDRAERMELQARQEAREAADTLDRSPKPFNYGFEIEDEQGNTNFRKEDSDGGQGGVRGVYGYKDPYGIYRVVEYIANTDGFRAVVKTNEPGTGDQDPADAAVFAQPQGPPGYRKLSGPVVPGKYLRTYTAEPQPLAPGPASRSHLY
ncbi:hypothetical protein LAZ67_10004139 [Cordylochernes scorpioides]|uniref:Uncharacterized protein n=1 Tax=Cordylochernes scorpioides TaxID=51811 RepID=A0ABY6L0A1_9ARAC|nr:hypothetical protein LAZ67_10004139 [Cordylochernes scorpioides]